MSAEIQRRKFLNEAVRRMSEFERTGIAYRAEDVHQYFVALATGRKAVRPKPINLKSSDA